MYRRQYYSFSRGRYFTNRLQHQVITLDSLADLVRFSFIVQKSLTPLDLKLCERYLNKPCFTLTYPSMVRGVNEHINTEEKCRKILATDRSVLYRLHLDLPKGREGSLPGRPKYGDLVIDSSIPHIGNIITPPDRLLQLLSQYIVKTLRLPGKELRILKWLVRFDEYSEIPEDIMYTLINFLYSEKIHSLIDKDFFDKFNFRKWMVENREKPEILEYLLYEAHHKGIILEDGRSCGLTDGCIFYSAYLHIGPTLKYNYASTYSMDICMFYLDSISFPRVGRIGSVIKKAETWMSPKRYYKLLQFLQIYSNFTISGCRASELAAASEAVRLLWDSVDDSFLTPEEIKNVLEETLTSEEITDMYSFYSRAVGESHSFIDPRSLKHLCRTAIRAFLWVYKVWIPDGIRQMDLPEQLQSYLNLEKVHKKQSES